MQSETEAFRIREVKMLHCLRCGHDWIQRFPDKLPKNCANCNSPSWMKPKGERKPFTWQSEETKARARQKPHN